MIKDNFRITSDIDEIKFIIRDYISSNIPALIWQKIEGLDSNDDERILTKGSIIDFNEETNLVQLKFHGLSYADLHLDSFDTLYIKGPIKNILFKIKVLVQEEGTIHFKLPEELYTEENRICARTKYDEFHPGKIEFFLGQTHIKNKKYNKLKIADLSLSGVGVTLSSGIHQWTPGDVIQITRINNHELESTVQATICYLKSSYLKTKTYRMGIQFTNRLSSSELDFIQAN